MWIEQAINETDDVRRRLRVSPAEVEQELAKHPAVAEVAVTEAAIREGVSIIAAFVVAHGEKGSGLASELAAFASGVLAAYKCPREYIFVQALPKTPNVKIRRGDLRSTKPLGAYPKLSFTTV